MTYDYARKVHPFFFKNALLFEPSLGMGMSMGRDRNARFTMRLRHRAEHAFDSRGHALLVCSAFEDGCLDGGAGYALFDVLNKHVDHHLRTAERGSRPPKVKVHWQIVVGVHSGRNNDVEIGIRGDSLDTRDVPAQTNYSQINNRINT